MHLRPSSVPGTMLHAGGEKMSSLEVNVIKGTYAGKARGGLKGNELDKYQVIIFISLFTVPTANK